MDLHHWPRNEIRILRFRIWTFSCRPTGWRFLEWFFFNVGWWIMLWKKPFQTCPLKSLKSVKISEIRVFPIHCHSARSDAKSQKLIVILRIVKRSPRIYRRTDDGFCNSGQWRPPCRMTRWMDENEFKDLRFCLIHQLPRIFKFSHERSLLTNCHVASCEAKSLNRIVILREAKRSHRN